MIKTLLEKEELEIEHCKFFYVFALDIQILKKFIKIGNLFCCENLSGEMIISDKKL